MGEVQRSTSNWSRARHAATHASLSEQASALEDQVLRISTAQHKPDGSSFDFAILAVGFGLDAKHARLNAKVLRTIKKYVIAALSSLPCFVDWKWSAR